MGRQSQQNLQSKLLDTASVVAVSALGYLHPEYFNPWNLSLVQWLVGAAAIRAAIFFYDHLVVFLMDTVLHSQLLPTRTTGKPVRFVSLNVQSYVFLTINALHEWLFVQRLLHYIWYSPHVSLELNDIGLVNTLGALAVIFMVNDFIYAPCHHLLHWPSLYPLIHKHHHRQHFPTRGYLDAGNEHPIEHLVGVLSIWGGVLAAVATCRVHGAAIFVYFNLHATLAMLNHSPYNVRFHLVPGLMEYSVGNHEMHHRQFTVNYAQYCMWYDHFMHTFAPYQGPKEA